MNTIKNLLKIKSLVTLVVLGMFVYGVITGLLGGEQIMTVVSIVITFYFAQKGGTNADNSVNSEFSDKSNWYNSDSTSDE